MPPFSVPQVHLGLGELEPSKPLSARRLQIVALVGEGLTYQEIGVELGISHRTVEALVAKIADLLPGNSTPYRKVAFYAHRIRAA